MLTSIGVALASLSIVVSLQQDDAAVRAEKKFVEVRDTYLSQFKPLWLQAQAAWWEANTTGSDAAFAKKKRVDKALVSLHQDRRRYGQIKAILVSDQVKGVALRRQLDVMHRAFKMSMADPDLQSEIVDVENDVAKIFNTHRSKVGDKTLTENDVREILGGTSDSNQAKLAWEGYMAVGGKVEEKLRSLVRMRNKVAKQIGAENFFSLRLELQEIDEEEFIQLFDELDALTRKPFERLKSGIDVARAAHFGISVAQLRPWHYGDLFFQVAPRAGGVNLDEVYQDADLVELTKRYYKSMGLDCDDVFARSDLFEKPGKSPHAFCSDLNREGDVRVLCNLKPNLYWADTLLHEIGHAVYDKYIDRDLPFLLREASHSITTEGMAMMFGAMAKNRDYLINVRGLEAEQAAKIVRAADEALKAEKIVFSRWTQVVVRFEQGMYADPEQDLGKLWWDLKKKYQLLNPPDNVSRPDYAAKVHILTYPVYYHSYLMGDLFAAQVRDYATRKVLGAKKVGDICFYGKPEVGRYFRQKVFEPGNLYSWNELTRRATGERLTAKYFAQQFVK